MADPLNSFEFVKVPPKGERRYDDAPPKRIFIYTAHDGDIVPEAFVKPTIDRVRLDRQSVEVRDWGANTVAKRLAAALGNGGYGRANIARILLDLNRFPGTTSRSATDPLDRFSIMEPFGSALRHDEKMRLLELYDEMSLALEEYFEGSLISIGIHTYDAHNPSDTKRPDVSLISTPSTYLRDSRLPDGLFDPMYPDMLAESSCSRVLRDRVSLNLERAGYRVTHNFPYPLPEGSIEVRAQVWSFFRFVKTRFELAHPNSGEDPGMRMVWRMLLDTNLRDARADTLRSYLHRYRRPSSDAERVALERARDAYTRVREFVETSDVVNDYRRAPFRPSALAVEVRKDLLVTFGPDGRPLPRTDEQTALAENVAEVIAGAVELFLKKDRPTERGQLG